MKSTWPVYHNVLLARRRHLRKFNFSTGVIAQEGKTIAVDPSIIPYGSTVLIDGKEYLAQDCGGAIKGNKIDIFSEYPKQERYQVEIYIKREK